MGEELSEEDVAPVQVKGEEIEMVEHFTYLGSVLSCDGEVMRDVKSRIAKASRVFDCLRVPVFSNPTLSIPTKGAVYMAMVVSVLMYGEETWTLKAEHVRRLTTFCVRTILGVTRFQQWEQRITSKSLANKFGIAWSIADIILDRRLQWLGHLGRMEDKRLPKQVAFGELKKK